MPEDVMLFAAHAATGGVGAMATGGATALTHATSRKQSWAIMLTSMSLGAYVGPAISIHMGYGLAVSGTIGLLSGLVALGVMAWGKRLSDLIGNSDPAAALPKWLADRLGNKKNPPEQGTKP